MAKNGDSGFSRRLSVFILLFLMFVSVSEANAWWNDNWQYRKKIILDTTPTGADIKENLNETPILLRLHTGNLNFSNVQMDGADLRFVSSDETMLLKHHIEKFDSIDEMALVWVKVPRISGASSQDFIWMYYGNKAAVGGEDARGTYDVNQVAVYHFGEFEGLPQDQTAYDNHASEFTAGQGLPGVIGNCVSLNGAGDKIVIPALPDMDFSKGFTFSAWIRITQPQQDACIFSREQQDQAIVIGIDQTKVYCRITTGKDQVLITEKSTDLSLDAWHHLAVSAEKEGRLTVYLDGIETFWMNLSGPMPELASSLFLGASAIEGRFFFGDLDEVQISNAARLAAWLRAAARSQGPEGVLCFFGEEELNDTGGLPVFYLGTILRNITLDGWVIIGMLMIISALSWVVFVSKTFVLSLMEKDNKAFLVSFRGVTDPIALEGGDQDFQNSSLYGIYLAGRRELKSRLGNEEKSLPPRAFNAFKAALEKGLTMEIRKLNNWLLILTIAITGGPFLGLLGTVWGVMNTFAAMAAAGEANIMAIAPGIASALSTTVFGLIVAIPALFGYNYLTGRIKNITADMYIFADEFDLKADETYGASS
ncbi:MAG: DUF2341 domain-containing protein [Proteobacteria bacterium]|nr:DUF2341 domain-containing protein [Pseudomonadota bacterium]